MLAQKQPSIKRVRNSSLVERYCAENVPGLKHTTEAVGLHISVIGRGASSQRRSVTVRRRGFVRRENAGMSSERKVRILSAEYLRIPG